MTPSTTESAVEVKARGAFYTPSSITEFIAAWAIRDGHARVLEPSCGDGGFLVAASNRLSALGRRTSAGITGIEKSPHEAAKASALVPTADVRCASFFDVGPDSLGGPFDAVIGNPPYIRYHGFTGEERDKGLARANAQGVRLTRLASSWAHFVVHATSFLAEDGRLGLVLPAELLVTDYAQPIRAHLLARFASVVIVAFDRMVFSEAQVDAVLVLASSDGTPGIVVRVAGLGELGRIDLTAAGRRREPGERWMTSIDADAEATYRAYASSTSACRLADLASVDIGVVTGANAYFILTNSEADQLGVPEEYLLPVVERPRDVPGLSVQDAERSRLLWIPPGSTPTDPSLLRYLDRGVALGIPNGYKCRVRKQWYSVPLPRKRPGAFLPYMMGDAPRLIVNAAAAWSTNLLHGVSLKPDAPDSRAVSAAMLSSVTLLSSEVEGRSYGGGVLKLETKEAERLVVPRLLPDVAAVLARMHADLDCLVRDGQASRATRLVDAVLGIDSERFASARTIFRDRRLQRVAPGRSINPA